ncbi:MAG: dephospho-CoA kinase [Bacteroidota bacterium]|jgi:dephospho-CoA kinase|nr:dephospho-CoA kinase [Bacteroidota bacterium]HHU97330.1 dephospho-CoA kinase [Petrimonas sp.]
MVRIGVTGGIGSGKSVVCSLLHLHGIPVFNADIEAKRLNDTSAGVRKALTRHFGKDLYEGDRLNRQQFAKLIFNDKQNLAIANGIIHPALAKRFNDWCSAQSRFTHVAIDAPVLFEAGFDAHVDTVVVVYSPKELRVKRVMERDQVDREKVEARMQSQLPEEEKLKRANHVICNDGRHSLIVQVTDLLAKLSFFNEYDAG